MRGFRRPMVVTRGVHTILTLEQAHMVVTRGAAVPNTSLRTRKHLCALLSSMATCTLCYTAATNCATRRYDSFHQSLPASCIQTHVACVSCAQTKFYARAYNQYTVTAETSRLRRDRGWSGMDAGTSFTLDRSTAG